MRGPLLLLLAFVMLRGSHAQEKETQQRVANNVMNGIIESLMSPTGPNMTRLLSSFEVEPCMQRCVPSMGFLLDSLSKLKETDAKNTMGLCKELEKVEECASASPVRCESSLYDLVTKTYKFACVDKIEDLGSSLKCANEATASHVAECEKGCFTDKSKQAMDSNKVPIDVGGVCESSVCLLGCVQRSINNVCHSQDNSIFDSILISSTNSEEGTLSSLMQVLLPAQCIDILKKQGKMHLLSNTNAPSSVGKPNEMRKADAMSTTLTPKDAVLFGAGPVEQLIDMNGQIRTMRCQLLDWERRPVETPSIKTLARIVMEQSPDKMSNQPSFRTMDENDDEEPSKQDLDFARWAASLDRDSYRKLGWGARTQDSNPLRPLLRAAAEPSSASTQGWSIPTWANVLIAMVFPLVIYVF